MNETTTTTLPAINTAELTNIVSQAPAILEKNQESHDKAMTYGTSLIEKAQSLGMSENLDKLMADYLDKLRLTFNTINERRKPFTQLVDEVKKRFTSLESDIAPTGKDNIFANVQAWRNQYATEKIEQQKQKEREAAEKLAREKELVLVKQKAETEFARVCSEVQLSKTRQLNAMFNAITAETEMTVRENIANFDVKLPEAVTKLVLNERFVYVEPLAVVQITQAVAAELYPEANLAHMQALNVVKHELIDKIHSRLAELDAIAKAGADEAERLKAEAEARQKAEAERAEREATEAARNAAEQAAARAAVDTLNATINMQAEITTEAPKVKEAFEIVVKNPVAYALMFQFWFEKEGRNLPTDKIEAMTIKRMKAFCEAWALKNDEKITSPLIEYKEIYKAK